jgi:predicted dehydrogenase
MPSPRYFLPDRRTFLKEAAVAGLGAGTALGATPSARAEVSAGEKIICAVIGVRGRGRAFYGPLAGRKDTAVAALCDVNANVLGPAVDAVTKAQGQAPKAVADFRRVLDDKSIDAVVIATPHHWHGPIAIRALQAGKHVYLEKPASHVYREGPLLVQAARKYKRVVQHGTQMRSSEVTARAGELLRSGALGEIKMAKAWNVQRHNHRPPGPDAPVPSGLDYDFWLGPAPERPFNPNRFGSWQWVRDYGNGDIGNDGSHDIDMACFGLGVDRLPIRVTAHGSRIDLQGEREFPDNMLVTYQFDNNKVLIYEDRGWAPYGMDGFDSGNAFYGTKGYMIFSRRGSFQVYWDRQGAKGPGMKGDGGQERHLQNFLDCVRSGQRPNADALTAHLTCALVHLGEVAYRTERVLHFDPKTETIQGDREANALLTKEYRNPWEMPREV